MCFCVLCVIISVPAATSVKGFDEDSVASLSTTQDETQDTHMAENGITNNSSHPFQGGGYMLAASYWPKVTHCTIHHVTHSLIYNDTSLQ